jgi:phosphotransferase system IIB component
MEYSMSTLKTNTIQAATGSTVNVASGHKLSGAAGSIVAPGQVIQVVSGTHATETSFTSSSFF